MSEAAGVPNWRQALDTSLHDLGRLRNQTGPTIAFKKWRQATIDAIQALWPEERTKVSRFLRIPFLPPSAHAERAEIRRVYDRGCGEAQAYLKSLIAEHDREIATGLRASASAPAPPPGAAGPVGDDGLPNLSWLEAAPAADAELPAEDAEELRSAADDLLSASPVFSVRGVPGAPRPEAQKPELSPSALAIMAMAVEVESLGVPEGDRPRVREALLDLARTVDTRLTWRQLRATVEVVMEYPTVGRRVLPLLLPFLDRAA